MRIDEKIKAYKLYSFIRFLIEEVILAVALSWFVPSLGINIPPWLLIVVMEVWAIYSYLTSKLAVKAINKPAVVGTEALVGIKGITTTLLSPDGWVRVGTELWQAHSTVGDIETGVEVVITGIHRLTLLVKPSTDTSLE
jgi:membrane-bound ClpP family serine protease